MIGQSDYFGTGLDIQSKIALKIVKPGSYSILKSRSIKSVARDFE